MVAYTPVETGRTELFATGMYFDRIVVDGDDALFLAKSGHGFFHGRANPGRQRVIVNIGSVATRGIYRVPYSAAKGGVHAVTVCLAKELADYNIRVNCVAPGAIEANRAIPRNPDGPTEAEKLWRREMLDQTLGDTCMQRMGTAGEVADAVAFLAGDDASYITGQVLYVSGGGIG